MLPSPVAEAHLQGIASGGPAKRPLGLCRDALEGEGQSDRSALNILSGLLFATREREI